MTHLPYILAAYLASGATLLGMAVWIASDLREQKRRLRRLEDAGTLRRRSEAAP
jgi:heme exporter protein CcmD